MPKSGNKAGDNFPISVLTDQNLQTRTTVAEENHQLLRVPEREDDRLSLSIERIDRLIAALIQPHRPLDRANQQPPERGQQGKLDPLLQPLFQTGSPPALVTDHMSPLTPPSYIRHVLKLHRVQTPVETVPTQQLLVRSDFGNRAAI